MSTAQLGLGEVVYRADRM